MPATDIVRRSDGIVVTSPPRTAFDAAAVLNAEDLESFIEQGIRRGWFIIPTLWATARRLRGRRRDLKVRARGWEVERVTDIALETDLAGTIEDLWAVWQKHLRRRASGEDGS